MNRNNLGDQDAVRRIIFKRTWAKQIPTIWSVLRYVRTDGECEYQWWNFGFYKNFNLYKLQINIVSDVNCLRRLLKLVSIPRINNRSGTNPSRPPAKPPYRCLRMLQLVLHFKCHSAVLQGFNRCKLKLQSHKILRRWSGSTNRPLYHYFLFKFMAYKPTLPHGVSQVQQQVTFFTLYMQLT